MAIILRSRVASVAPVRYDNVEALERARRIAGAKLRKEPRLVPARLLICKGKHESLTPRKPTGKFYGAKRDWSNKGGAPGPVIDRFRAVETCSESYAMTHAFAKAQERKASVQR
tara:strand:- start:57 stop:398 length:342 start_codon:yes stop_codon:yes gene_type:complete